MLDWASQRRVIVRRRPTSVPHPGAPGSTGRTGRLLVPGRACGRNRAHVLLSMSIRGHPRPRLFDHPRAQRDGEAVGPWACRSTPSAAPGPAPMMTRAFDARMLMAQRQGKTSFYMQHHGRGGGELRLPQGARARRHELPDLSPGRAADRRRLSDGRHDEPDLFQRGRSAEGPPAAGHVLVARSTASSRSPATSPRSTSRRSAGRWPRRSSATRDRRRPGSATARPPNPTSTPRWSSPRPTRRRWCSTSSTTSGRSRPSRASPRGGSGTFAARGLGFGIPALRVDGNDYLAVHAVAQMGGRAGAAQSRADADRVRHLSRRRAFDLRRSLAPTGRRPNPTPGRSATRCCG